jgi:hypothetical protein
VMIVEAGTQSVLLGLSIHTFASEALTMPTTPGNSTQSQSTSPSS